MKNEPKSTVIKPDIFLISDILMTKEKEQFSNLRWFRDFLSRRILKATGHTPKGMTSSLSQPKQLNRRTFFSLSGIELDINETQFFFDETKIVKASKDYLTDFIPRGSIVIGYELSRQTRRIFDSLNITYIDVWLHPIRYLDDILFAFNSNNEKVIDHIAKFNLDDEHFYLYADKFKISTYKGFKRVGLDLAQNSAMFVGQTLSDKAICKDGKMLSILDFKDKFEQLTKEYSKVYYSRHPYVNSGDENIISWLKTFSNVEVVSHSAYHMLSNQNIKKVVSISSSVVHEAKYFSKEAEFWFKPIFHLNENQDFENYTSIYQDFVSPSFWSDILAPVIQTKKCKKISFLSDKDKLRDMLGFYYSYKHVDKAEQIRQTLLAVDRKVQRMDEEKSSTTVKQLNKKTKDQNVSVLDPFSPSKLAEAKRLILNSKVASFDIFDTLVQRRVEQPNDIFLLMEQHAEKLGIKNFAQLRSKARGLVNNNKGEEILLLDRYTALYENDYLTLEQSKSLYQLELDIELEVCEKRNVGCELLEYALKKRKKVILISDIFFDQKFVELILQKIGINNFDKLYVSSDIGLLKHTGKLFDHVSRDLSINPQKIIHFGDNEHADGKMAIKHGFKSFILPANKVIADKVLYYKGDNGFSNLYVESVIKGLVNNKVTDGLFKSYNKGLYNDPYKFGYSVMGPILTSFSAWLLEEAKKQKLTKLFFLARDGEIIKKCYDQLAKGDAEAPKSEYLLCSRRAVNVPKIKTVADIIEVASVNYSPVKLSIFLNNRFGINATKIALNSFKKCGFDSRDEIINFNLDNDKVIALLKLESSFVFENSKEERTEILSYFKDKKFNDAKNIAVVDIGHNGTMQKSLSQLTGNKNLAGFYFMTFAGAKNVLGEHNLPYYSFAGHNVDEKVDGGNYFKFILMFELLFLNTKSSFVRFNNGKAMHLPSGLEGNRVKFISSAHEGCCDFAVDCTNTVGITNADLISNPSKLLLSYVKLLENPRINDALLFEGICFENIYSARDSKYICLKQNNSQEVVWKQAQQVINEYHSPVGIFPEVLKVAFKTAHKIGLLNSAKYQKFQVNPSMFFKDSKYSVLRKISTTKLN